GRRAYLTREEAEYDAEDISELLGEPFEIRELTVHQNTEVPFCDCQGGRMMTGAADSHLEIDPGIQSWYPMWKPPAERHGWLSCLCPFHDETRPSASVNYEKNAFNCHGCGMKGDIIALIRRKEGLSYGEAVKRAASLVDGGGKAVSQLPRRKSGRGVFGRSGTSGTRKTIWSRVR